MESLKAIEEPYVGVLKLRNIACMEESKDPHLEMLNLQKIAWKEDAEENVPKNAIPTPICGRIGTTTSTRNSVEKCSLANGTAYPTCSPSSLACDIGRDLGSPILTISTKAAF